MNTEEKISLTESPSSPPGGTLKHTPKRTGAQRAADLVFLEYHHLRGKTHAEMAEMLNRERGYSISRQQVAYDLKKLEKKWLEDVEESFAASKAKALRKLAVLEAEAWAGWEASKQGEVAGDASLLGQMLQIQDRRAKLLGLYAPARHEVSGPDGNAISIETRDLGTPLKGEAKRELLNRHFKRWKEEEAVNGSIDQPQ